MARQREQAHRREHGGEPEQERDRRSDERSEHEQEDPERERDREQSRAPELRLEHLLEGLPGRDCARLAYVEAGVGFLDLVDYARDRVDVRGRIVVRALRAELDQRRVTVLRDLAVVAGREWRAKLRDLRKAVEPPNRLDDDGAERRIVDRLRLRLHEDELALLVDREAAVPDDVIGLAGFADVRVGVVDLVRADGHADRERDDDEREPPEDRRLAVSRAPAAHASRDVGAVLER
jgi:hypothetical protein